MPRVYLNDSDDLIDICRDNVFKAVFTRDTPESKGALSKLISALISWEVTVTTISINEPPIDSLRDRQIRFDINCRTQDGKRVNIEMSFNPTPFEPVRLEYYGGKLFIGQDIRGIGKTYDDLNRAYQIAILAKERYFDDEALVHSFEYYDAEHRVSLNGRSRIITMELAKAAPALEKRTEEMSAQEQWGVYFRYLTDKGKRGKINELIACEEGIAMASDVLVHISKDDVERARLISEEKYELDTQTRLVVARREGILEGEQRGEQRGRREGKQEILDLLRSGKSPEEIIRDYGE